MKKKQKFDNIKIKILETIDNQFILNNEEIEAIEKEKNNYEDYRSVSIAALKIVQKRKGWVSDEAIKAISNILNISICEIESVATFYSQIFRRPVGRNIIKYCDSVVCYILDYKKIKITIEKLLNIKPGQTTLNNRFTLLPVCCLGLCDKGPIIMINDKIYFNVKNENISLILENHK